MAPPRHTKKSNPGQFFTSSLSALDSSHGGERPAEQEEEEGPGETSEGLREGRERRAGERWSSPWGTKPLC